MVEDWGVLEVSTLSREPRDTEECPSPRASPNIKCHDGIFILFLKI
jgi:hypothetical protein